MRAAQSASAVMAEAGKIRARQRRPGPADASIPRRAAAPSLIRFCDPDGRAA